MGIAHWDEVERHRRAKGEMDAEWQRLGDAAGTIGVGVNRVRVAPGRLPTPPHSHGASEELYYVLGGSGLAWQDEDVHEVRSGDCVIQPADSMEHTFVAGDEASTTSCSAPATRPRSRGCRVRGRCGQAGRGWRAATTIPGTSRRRLRRCLGEPAPGRPTSSTSTRQHRTPRRGQHEAAGDPRALGPGGPSLGAAGEWTVPARRRTATPRKRRCS